MRDMRRLLFVVACALAVAGPAAADKPKPKPVVVTTSGTLVTRSATSVTVQDGSRTVTCSVTSSSPKLGDLKAGDRVKLRCTNGVVSAIAKSVPPATAPPATAPSAPQTQTAAGTLTALSAASLTVHTDGGDVTCTLTDASPKVGDLQVGDTVKLACANGALVAIARVDAPKPPPDETKPGLGTVTSLTPTSVTVHTDGGDVTCSVTGDSTGAGDVRVGDNVKFYCSNGVLRGIAKVAPPAPPAPVIKTGRGTLTSVRVDGVTVHTDGGDVVCKLTSVSPALGDLKLGDSVEFACSDGVLTAITKVAPANVRSAQGTLSTLSADSLTVTTDGGAVTCGVGPSSPALGDYHVGDHVKMYCVNDVLYFIAHVS
jgi:hypothetical protein